MVTKGSVIESGGQTKERIFALGGVLIRITTVWWRINRQSRGGAGETKEQEKSVRFHEPTVLSWLVGYQQKHAHGGMIAGSI